MAAKKTKAVVALSLIATTGVLAAWTYLGRGYILESWHLFRFDGLEREKKLSVIQRLAEHGGERTATAFAAVAESGGDAELKKAAVEGLAALFPRLRRRARCETVNVLRLLLETSAAGGQPRRYPGYPPYLCRVVVELAQSDPAILPCLLPALRSPSPAVQQVAAFAITQHAPAVPAVVEELFDSATPDEIVPFFRPATVPPESLYKLPCIDTSRDRALDLLTGALDVAARLARNHRDPRVRALGLSFLMNPFKSDLEALTAAYENDPSHLRLTTSTGAGGQVLGSIGLEWCGLRLGYPADVEAQPPPVAEDSWWRHLRDVPAARVAVRGEVDSALFYDGAVNMPGPLRVSWSSASRDELLLGVRSFHEVPDVPAEASLMDHWWLSDTERDRARTTHPVPAVFVLSRERAGDLRGRVLEDLVPLEAGEAPLRVALAGLPLGEAEVRSRFTDVIEGRGLTPEEIRSLVRTWEKEFFEAPGRRVITLLPQWIYDAVLPMEVFPVPGELVRVGLVWRECEDLEIGVESWGLESLAERWRAEPWSFDEEDADVRSISARREKSSTVSENRGAPPSPRTAPGSRSRRAREAASASLWPTWRRRPFSRSLASTTYRAVTAVRCSSPRRGTESPTASEGSRAGRGLSWTCRRCDGSGSLSPRCSPATAPGSSTMNGRGTGSTPP